MSITTISSTRATRVDWTTQPFTVLFANGSRTAGTVYYKASPDVSSSSFDGSLAPGGVVALSATTWFIASTASDGSLGSAVLSVDAASDDPIVRLDTGGNPPNTAQLVANAQIPDGSSDNTAYLSGLIARAVSQGKTLRIPPGSQSWVISELTLPSNATVDATGATFIPPAGTNKRMVVNTSLMAGSPGAVRDSNIEWRGGTFVKGTGQQNVGTLDDMMLMFGFVDGFKLIAPTISQSGTGSLSGTGGTYGCYLYGVTNFRVVDYTANSASLAVNQSSLQLYGGCQNGVIDGVYGAFGDDCVALVPRNPTSLEIASQTGIADIINVKVKNVFATSPSNGVKLLGGSTAGVAPFFSVRRCLVENVRGNFGSRAGCGAIYVGGDTNYSSLTNGFVLDCEVKAVTQTRATTAAVRVRNSGEVHGLVLRACNNQEDSSAILIETIGHASVKVADCSYTTAITAGSYYPITVTATTCRTLELENVRLNAATTGTAVVAPVLGTSGPGRLVVRNVPTTGRAFLLGDFRSTTRIFASGIQHEDANGQGYFVTNTGAAVTVAECSAFQTGVDDFTQTAGTVVSQSLGFRCDIAKLTKTAGNQAYNTNAGTGALGPWVCDGTNWKHLFTGVTI